MNVMMWNKKKTIFLDDHDMELLTFSRMPTEEARELKFKLRVCRHDGIEQIMCSTVYPANSLDKEIRDIFGSIKVVRSYVVKVE